MAREPRKLRPDLAVLLMTGYCAAASAAKKDGFQLLTKPIPIDALERETGALLSG